MMSGYYTFNVLVSVKGTDEQDAHAQLNSRLNDGMQAGVWSGYGIRGLSQDDTYDLDGNLRVSAEAAGE